MKHRMAILFVALGAAASVAGQDEQSEVRTRQLWDSNLKQKRTEAVNRPAHDSQKGDAGRKTAVHKQPGSHPSLLPISDAFIGVTLWSFRPSRTQDAPSARMLVHDPDSDKDEQWTPERSMAEAPLHQGQRVRLSIESAREGYLYVIDREQYADGSFGEAQMIFPTRKMRHSDNRVQAGKVVDIPANGDGSFRVQRNRKDQVAEEVTILVSPDPLEGVKIGQEAQPVSRDQLAAWKKKWSTAVKQLEARDQVGRTYTSAEREASDQGTLLGETDPLPQTMFEVQAAPGKPLLVTMPLRIQ